MTVEQGNLDAFAKVKTEAFEKHKKPIGYIAHRGLMNSQDTKRGIFYPWGYNDTLPIFDSLKLESWIERMITQKGRVSLLDVGCGYGNYLADCKGRWGENVRCVGVTSRVFYTDEQMLMGLSYGDVLTDMRESGVDIRIADAQALGSAFPIERFDIVTATHLADYLADSWSLIEGVYSVLEDRGVGFINEFPMRISNERNVISLVDYLKTSYGMEVNESYTVGGYYNFAFQKTQSEIDLPLLPDRIQQTKDLDNVIIYKYAPVSTT